MAPVPASASAVLLCVLQARLNPQSRGWLVQALEESGSGPVRTLLHAHAVAAHRVGRRPFALVGQERMDLRAAVPEVGFESWTLLDAARVLLLLNRAARDAEAWHAAVIACYGEGDAGEQQAVLKAIPLLPEPHLFLPLMIDACRTSIQPLFEAVACENPYPARFFPEPNFNQMVLKAIFNGVSLSRVVGLRPRLNRELSRMAADYASERRAAARDVPSDLALLTEARIPGSTHEVL
jgi:hypothetical protein